MEESTQEVKEEAGAKKNGITMEDLLNHSAAPEEDFTFTYTTNGGVTIDGYKGTEEILVIPDTIQGKPVEKIASYTFGEAGNDSVRAVKLPDSVVELEMMAFSGNESLEIIVLSSGLKKIGESCFMGCTELKEIELNEGLEKLENYVLYSCEKLQSVSVPNSVVEFGYLPFGLCAEGFVVYGSVGSGIEKYYLNLTEEEKEILLNTYGVRIEIK